MSESSSAEVPQKIPLKQRLGNWISEKLHGPNPEGLDGPTLLAVSRNYNDKAHRSLNWARVKGSISAIGTAFGLNESTGLVLLPSLAIGAWAAADYLSAEHNSELAEKYKKLSDKFRIDNR